MLKSMPFNTHNALTKYFRNVPAEYKEELRREILCINISREKILSYILIITNLLLLFVHLFTSRLYGNSIQIFGSYSYYHILLFIIPIVFLVLANLAAGFQEEDSLHVKMLHLALNILILTLCSVISVHNGLVNPQPFAYVTAMFCIASLELLSRLESLAIFSFSYLLYVNGAFISQKDLLQLLREMLFMGLLVIMSLIVSNINYYWFVRNFLNKKVIEKKNEEIDRMYKISEDALKKRTEELNETMEYEKLRTAFFTNISHELRTPLTVIYSAEQMLENVLRDALKPEKQKEVSQYMHITKQNCYRLIRLIANLIDITKIDAGYFLVSLKNCNIVNIVEDITLSVAKFIEDRNISLTFDTEDEEKVIACDPDKIERVMLNLLSNAVKFTGPGGSIFVNMYNKGGRVVISVKDTGVGIPPEMQDAVFDRFVQVDRSTSRSKEGSGIGLSIVKSLVEMHSGCISLISEPGKGCEFIIEIPDRKVDHLKGEKESEHQGEKQFIEKINIEFSDIYN